MTSAAVPLPPAAGAAPCCLTIVEAGLSDGHVETYLLPLEFVWGAPDGSFVEQPYFGPATTRDAFGGVVDTAADPLGWTLERAFGWAASAGTSGLDAYVHLGDWKRAEVSSIDFYSFLRSAYYQTRRAQLREGLGLPPATESPATESPATESPAATSLPPRRHRVVSRAAAAPSPQ